MTVGRKLSFENVRPQNSANRQDDISNLRREVTLEDLKTHKLVKKKISMFEDKQGREKKEEFGRERSLRRKPEATARSEDVMKVQKTPMKKIKIRKMEDKMTPTSWKKRKRSAIRGLQEELATKRGGGMMGKIVGGLRLGAASARRNLETLKDENLETDKLEDTSLLTEVSSPLNGTQVRRLFSGIKITCPQESSPNSKRIPDCTDILCVQSVQAPYRQLGGGDRCTGDSSTSSMGHSLAKASK